ncbi:MAG: Ig-like domain-containing protein [bacterium]
MNAQIKKTISLGAVLILVTSALVFQTPTASAVQAGDLVKIPGNTAVYYIGADNKRYVFPHFSVYDTWYQDYSQVKTITLAELQTYAIGGNITVRPGTKLIKIQSDPSVYAVSTNGALHKIDSETRAKTLYGANWAKRVIDVSDAFFVNYIMDSAISSDQHPDGTLIQYDVLPGNKYLVGWNGKKRIFKDDATFALNGFVSDNVITTTLNYPDSTQIVEKENTLSEPKGVFDKPIEETKKIEVAQLIVTTDHSQIAANGQAKAIVTVTLKDANGQIVTDASEPVSFSSSNSLGTVLSTNSAVPSAGIASTVLTAGYQAGAIEVVVSLNNLSKAVTINIVGVDVVQPGVTIMYDPSLIWPLYKDSAGSNEDYTLTWNKIENVSIDYYIVEEATNSTFTEGLAQYTVNTNSITLNHAYPQTKKYFYRVKGVHNTVEGLWSGSLDGNVVNHEVTGTDI